MYRIAVIENETELQSYGHANVVRNLTQAVATRPDGKFFNFQSFTSANIDSLFQKGSNYILNFDGIFISTNACSDKVTLDCLRKNRSHILEFINNGRGLYIGYQKKLSTELKDKETEIILPPKIYLSTVDKTPFDFLPEEYKFRLIEEFSFINESELIRVKESSEGDIKIYDKNHDDVILNHPKNIKQNEIVQKCRKNDFQNHLYKSSIYPFLQGSYESLLYDDAPDDSYKRLLLIRAVPKKNERIIVSSIVLDWENHAPILLNIIEYIAKGIPRFAFIQGDDVEANKDFNYLINSAIIAKIPNEKYKNAADISVDMQFIHDVYFFAPNVNETEVSKFWKKLKGINKNKKIYHMLIHSSGETVLKQYSNTSSLDLLKANVATWFKGYMVDNNGYWDGFWVTYDALLMMKAVGIDYSSYLENIYAGIYKRRHSEGSYDRLIGCTLGMLKLLVYFWPHKQHEISQTLKWIDERIFSSGKNIVDTMPISAYEKESYLLIFKELEGYQSENYKINVNGEKYDKLIEEVYNTLVKPQRDGKDCTEIELCRHLQFCIVFNKTNDIKLILDAMFNDQKRNYEGKWTGVGRTAGVLIAIMNSLGKENIIGYKIEKKIEESINYILELYSRENSNWNNLVLDTSRALHALALYNEMFSLSSRDFFETVQRDAEIIGYNNIIESSLLTSSELQKNLYGLSLENEALKTANKQLTDSIFRTQNELATLFTEMENTRKTYEKQWRVSTALLIFFGLIILGLIFFIHFDLKGTEKLITSIGSIIALALSLFIAFFIEEYLQKKVFSKSKSIKRK